MMSGYSPDSDLMPRNESAEISPLNASVIKTFDSAYGNAEKGAESSDALVESAKTDVTTDPTLLSADLVLKNLDSAINNIPVSTGATNKDSAATKKVSKVPDKKFVSAYNTLALPSTVTARILNFGIDPPTFSEDERIKQFCFVHDSLLPKRKNVSPVSQEVQTNSQPEPLTNKNSNENFQKRQKSSGPTLLNY